MIFQILDANYTYDSKRNPLVQLFGSTPEGRSISCRVTGFRPYFYAGVKEGMLETAARDLEAMGLEVEKIERFEPIGYQVSPKKMLKITTQDPKEVRILREKLREIEGIKAVYETDILFMNRFLIEMNLGGMSWADVPLPEWVGSKAGPDAPMVNADSIMTVQHETNAPLRFMSFDIECLPLHGEMPKAEVSPVILISMADFLR